MSSAHLHLILAHVPVVGLFLSFVLLAYAAWRRDPGALKIALVGLAFSGLMAVPVYFSGEGAEEVVEGLAGVTEAAIERHEDAALVAAVLSAITGAFAALALFLGWRRGTTGRSLTAAVALSALIAFGAIGWTASLGGEIRHTEIAAGGGAAQDGAGEGQGEQEQGEEEEEEDDDDDDASLREAPAPPVTAVKEALQA